jgi:hypothetical protein
MNAPTRRFCAARSRTHSLGLASARFTTSTARSIPRYTVERRWLVVAASWLVLARRRYRGRMSQPEPISRRRQKDGGHRFGLSKPGAAHGEPGHAGPGMTLRRPIRPVAPSARPSGRTHRGCPPRVQGILREGRRRPTDRAANGSDNEPQPPRAKDDSPDSAKANSAGVRQPSTGWPFLYGSACWRARARTSSGAAEASLSALDGAGPGGRQRLTEMWR